jgi:hypothetical protein
VVRRPLLPTACGLATFHLAIFLLKQSSPRLNPVGFFGIWSILGEDKSTNAVEINWDILRMGRDWRSNEVWQRWQLAPEKIELIQRKIFGTDEDRIRMLGLLLELLGMDRAVQLGDSQMWRDAVNQLLTKQ